GRSELGNAGRPEPAEASGLSQIGLRSRLPGFHAQHRMPVHLYLRRLDAAPFSESACLEVGTAQGRGDACRWPERRGLSGDALSRRLRETLVERGAGAADEDWCAYLLSLARQTGSPV